jgi:hypothetical protein
MAMTLISTTTVGAGGAASIDFTAIPGTYTDLFLVASLRDTTGGTGDGGFAIRFNASTSGYATRFLGGNGSSATSSTGSSSTLIGNNGYGGDPYAGTTANTFGSISVMIPNFAGSSAKTASIDAVGENNATTAYQSIAAASWTGTSAITQVTLLPATLFAQYSVVSLYGITKGSGGATAS